MFTFYTTNARIEINETLGKLKNEYLAATIDFGLGWVANAPLLPWVRRYLIYIYMLYN
jgi:hypothetical protein